MTSIVPMVFLGFLMCYFPQIDGNICFDSYGSFGTCMDTNECFVGQTEEVIVRSNCKESQICCPKILRGNEYNTGWKQSEKLEDIDFAVAIGYKFPNGIIYRCGGALIQQNMVLTSAACCDLPLLSKPIVVLTATKEKVPISSIVVHPKYDGQKNDLALLILAKKATVTETCITTKNNIINQVQIVGFGTLSADNMLHGTIYNKSRVMTGRVLSSKDDTFTVGNDGNYYCFADKGGVAIIKGDRNLCPFPVVGVLSKWIDCEEPNSVGYFTKVRFP